MNRIGKSTVAVTNFEKIFIINKIIKEMKLCSWKNCVFSILL